MEAMHVKKMILVISQIWILVFAGVGVVAAQDEVPEMITQRQADALAAVIRHQAIYRHDMDFAQELSQFPPSRRGGLILAWELLVFIAFFRTKRSPCTLFNI